MAQRVFFMNTLKPGVKPEDYEDWVRRVDYPIARKQESIQSYVVTRLDGMLNGDGDPPFQYLEVIEITDLDAYRGGMQGNPEFEKLLEEWGTYVADSVMVHGEVIE
jgi:hypothetical protein